MRRREYTHASRLDDLCTYNGLIAMGEIPALIKVIIKEPYVYRGIWPELEKTPDLFIAKSDGLFTVAELKQSYNKRDKACEQIEAGMKTLVDVFGVPLKNITGKFIIYTQYDFKYEVIK